MSEPPPESPQQPPPYGMPPGGHPPYGWQPPYPAPGNTNGYAIASLVCALLGLLVPFVGGILGVTFGVIAIRQIDQSHARGRGLAIAGIVVAAIVLVLDVAGIAVLVSGDSTGGGSGGYPSV